MMKKLGLILAISATVIFSMVVSSEATLIGGQLSLPDITSNATGTETYTASNGLLVMAGTPLSITFDGTNIINITGTRSYLASFYLDSAGNFVGGVAGYDLQIYGNIDVDGDGTNDLTGLLVGGEVTDFGWFDTPGSSALFDFTFDFKAGALADYYAANDNKGYDFTTVEGTTYSTFNGDWTTNHSAKPVKHDTAPVPEPASVALLGLGLVGFAGSIVKKFKA